MKSEAQWFAWFAWLAWLAQGNIISFHFGSPRRGKPGSDIAIIFPHGLNLFTALQIRSFPIPLPSPLSPEAIYMILSTRTPYSTELSITDQVEQHHQKGSSPSLPLFS
ncbi:hypothetical protein B0T10DRAFT_464579 [Thelonectria olida]|uniref:Secreted protein n=1 Tax=Thelonectria olida TaxID=1576542 RepID=A0A9P8VU52_9HYPO|nr:hypothetical protein B0T10DRAFT_464579 [Thelonectria olida]